MESRTLYEIEHKFAMNETNVMHLNKTINESIRVDVHHHEQRIVYILLTVMLSFLSIVGILGNIPVLIVFCRRKDRKASNTFIKILAFLDLIVCAFVMPYSIVYEYHLVTSDIACRMFEFLIHFAIASSNITLVAIATERYIAVCRIGKRINVKIINRGMYGILVLGVLIAAPSVGTFAVVNASEVEGIRCSYPHEITEGTFCHFTYKVMGKGPVKAYQITQMIVFFVELIAIIVLYSIIYSVLWKKTQIRKSLTRHRESCTPSERQLPVEENVVMVVNNSDKQENATEIYTEIDNSKCIRVGLNTSNKSVNNIADTSNHNEMDSSAKDLLGTNVTEKADSRVTFEFSSKNDELCDASENDSGNSSKSENKQRSNVCFEVPEKAKPRRSYHRRTAKMLFLCTVIYFLTWMPFWIDIFEVTNSLLLRYVFFIGHATNPVVYGIVNKQVRASFKRLLYDCLKSWCKDGNIPERPSNTENASISGTSV